MCDFSILIECVIKKYSEYFAIYYIFYDEY